jgi:hypothetical protein
MVAAIYRGLIQFALFNEPFVREAEKLDFKTLRMCHHSEFRFTGRRPDEPIRAQSPARFFPSDFGADKSLYVYTTEKDCNKAQVPEVNDPESLEWAYNSLKTILPETRRRRPMV